MRIATCLILEPTDFTPDMNLRKEAFEAIGGSEIILHDARVIKNAVTGAVTASSIPEIPKRRRAPRTATPPPAPTPPAAPIPNPYEAPGSPDPRDFAEPLE